MVAKGTPSLIDLGTWKFDLYEDIIGTVWALQVLPLAVEEMGGNERFISRFKEGGHKGQSIRAGNMGNMKKLTFEEKEFFRRVCSIGAGAI
jgi:hypothetical protein